MQTAAIPYRVADFLKQHPPLQFIGEADLVSLAMRGRVKFHEPDEYIVWQSAEHTPYLYVIQQGAVSLWDETTDPPTLCDILGVGDSIGLERFNGVDTSLYSAKASSEVLLYALEAAEFQGLIARYPRVGQYVAAYSAVTADYAAPGDRPQAHEILLADLVRDRNTLSCPPSTPIREAARLLSESGTQALALANGKELIGILTASDFLRWIAAGAENPEQTVEHLSRGSVVTLAPHTPVSDCVLAMAEARATAAAMTGDGTDGTALQGIVAAASLVPAFGDHPLVILREIGSAVRVESLRALNERARAWILDSLGATADLDWIAAFADLVNRGIVERLMQIAGDASGSTLCFYGPAGRRELLTSVAPRIAAIGAMSAGLAQALSECGYLFAEAPVAAILDEWKARFTGWIRDPIRNQVSLARPFFDLRPVLTVGHEFRELESHIRAELAEEPYFLRVLANDCLSTLPPLTFFRDLVVEESGEESETFRLGTSALDPLVDVARVFGIACGAPLGSSTRERFDCARRRLPDHEVIFRSAADTMRVLLLQQARAGLRLRSDGSVLPLAMLSRQDRHFLKVGFRAIHRILEFTAPGEWLESF